MKLAISSFKKRALFIARNEVCEGYVFIGVCLSTGWGVVCMGEGVGQTPPIGYYGIWSTSGRYASYWNTFLLVLLVAGR